LSLPSPDVIEVSLIGPGYGESIIIHLGDGEWIIVDSCIQRLDPGGGQSAAIAYLREIGVDLSQVSRVIATHWHDDHISGLSQVINECASADFCCAMALSEAEFLGFASAYAEADPSPIARSTREIIDILELLETRGKTPIFLKHDTLMRRTDRNVSAYALSPSNERIRDFLARVATNMPALKATRTRVGDMRPNAIAVAILIDLVTDAILLGADVEETPGGAWSTIIVSSEALRGRRSSVYKVAHHGSETGECAAIWEEFLLPSPFAILTPNTRLSKPLPSAGAVDRILQRTPHAYSTARLASTAPRRRDIAVERTLRENGWKIRAVEPKAGHVRLRRHLGDPSGEWSVELRSNATHLKHIRS
jgi:Metallo-beta-lactamase superfamily